MTQNDRRGALHFLKCLLFAILAAVASPGAAQAWWKSEWPLRKKLTVDTTPAGAGITAPIGTTAVLLRLYDGNFQFTQAKEDGSDLRFVAADDKTPLAYHIEKYDSLLNEAFVWVKIPDISDGTKVSFWLYYGNAGGGAARADDPKGSYDADMVLVYHFSERGSPPADSTGNGNNAQNAGTPSEGSMIGGGLRLDGHGAVTIPASPSLVWAEGGAMTWSAWIKAGALKPNQVIYSRKEGGKSFVIGVDNGAPFVEVTDANGSRRSKAEAPIAANKWRHLAVAAASPSITLYLDGEPYATLNAALPGLDAEATLGGRAEENGFSGEMDELEISRTARPAGFIKLAAMNQEGGDQAAKLLGIGEDEQPSNWLSWLSNGYVGIIIKSLTLDGWIVIGILMVMGVVSWCVMIAKASYLGVMGRANSAFMDQWRHVVADLTVLDKAGPDKVKSLGGRVDPATEKAIRKASIYRIYHIGAQEIQNRLGAEPWGGNARILSARAIQAVRASLDGGLVRETQKLNSKMVFLTLSISGGPFLGLLGTVVGVMITFAAIAAAGDVNVNAIAPGIAAALVATVAGLGVAIPALFGYNYLTSRIKDATSDMHVFVDEFVTRMAEFYDGSVFDSQTNESADIHASSI